MAWIESHQALARHPKLFRLAALLRINRPQAIGHLHLFWWWTLDYAPSGNVSVFASHEIAAAAEWTGNADKFTDALRETGWLTADGVVHDWDEYGGKLIEARAKDAERKRVQRMSDGRPVDVRGMSGVENSREHNTTGENKTKRAGEPPGFVRFWDAWPKHERKVDRKKCVSAWSAGSCEDDADKIVKHVQACKRSEKWAKDGGKYIESPLVYLHRRAWDAPPPPPAALDENAIPDNPETTDDLAAAAFRGGFDE